MQQYGIEKNKEFVKRLQNKYRKKATAGYGISLVYRKLGNKTWHTDMHQHLSTLITNTVYQKIQQYEKKYYHSVTNQDRKKLLATMEVIYSQPGEKKQLVHFMHKLGVVTKEEKTWKDTEKRLREYEEEMVKLRKCITAQEETIVKLKRTEEKEFSVKEIKREVIQDIRQEMRLERLRCGLD